MYKTTFSFIASAILVASSEANTLTFEPVVISATNTEQSLKEITSNLDVITSEDLEERHITSVLDALRSFTSIPVAQNGGLGQQSSFYQRGFKTENTVVMIDGIHYNDPTAIGGVAQLEHLMINDIERIEILYGPQSGVWGANASAGVINIITKKATDKLTINTNLEYGSYATTKVGTSISQKVGKLSYYIGANQLKTNGFSAQVPVNQDPELYEDDGYTNQTFNMKLGYNLTNQDSITGQFDFIDAKTDYDAYGTPNSSANEIHQINRLGKIGYRHSMNTKDFIDTTYTVTAFDKKDPLGYTKVFKGTNKELSVQGTMYYQNNSFLTMGATKLDSKDVISSKELDSKAIFLTNSNRFNNLILTESLRHDTYDQFNDKTTGKIGAKYFFNDVTSFSANYGTAYRVPSLYELYGSYGNTNLTPETTKGYDATVQYKNLSLTYFNNTIDNLIDFTSVPFGYNNVEGKSTFKGYEIKYVRDLSQTMLLDLSYNKLFAKDRNGNFYAKRPHDNGKAGLIYTGVNHMTCGVNANYIGTRYEGTTQTGRYTLWSAFANYDLNSNISLYLKGDNLTDKLYQEVKGYGSAGRSIFVGMNAKF